MRDVSAIYFTDLVSLAALMLLIKTPSSRTVPLSSLAISPLHMPYLRCILGSITIYKPHLFSSFLVPIRFGLPDPCSQRLDLLHPVYELLSLCDETVA